MRSITHFDLAFFLIGLFGLTLMIYGIIIETSPLRVEFSPYYTSIVPTGISIYIISVVYFLIKGLKKSQGK